MEQNDIWEPTGSTWTNMHYDWNPCNQPNVAKYYEPPGFEYRYELEVDGDQRKWVQYRKPKEALLGEKPVKNHVSEIVRYLLES